MRKYILSLSVGGACLLVFSALTTAETWTTKWKQLVAATNKKGKVVIYGRGGALRPRTSRPPDIRNRSGKYFPAV